MKKKQDSQIFDWLIEIVFLAVVFLVPTIFDRRLGIVFSGTKAAWMRTLGLLLITLWSFKHIITGKPRFFRSILDWPAATFLLCTTIATLTSVNVYVSLAGFYGRYEGLTSWYLFGLFFLVVTNFMRGADQLKRIIITVCSSSTIMAVYSIIQRHEWDPYQWGGVVTWQRVIGTIGQPNFLAGYMLMAFFLVLALLLIDNDSKTSLTDWSDQWQPLVYFFAAPALFVLMIYSTDAGQVLQWYFLFFSIAVLALLFAYTYQKLNPLVLNLLLGLNLLLSYICILYTQSRGGYMGLLTGGVLFTLVAGRRVLFAHWKKISVLGALVFIVSAVTMLRPEYSPIDRFSSEITTKQSESERQLELKGAAGSRGESWKSAFKIIADRPVFGIGPEVLKMVFPRYETDLFRFKETFHVKQDRCHNETFDVAVTKGLVAFFLYLWLISSFFTFGWRKAKSANPTDKLLVAGMLAAGLAYLIQNQFSFGVVAITSLFWIIMGMVASVGERGKDIEDIKGIKGIEVKWEDLPWLKLAGFGLVILFLIYVSFFSFYADVSFKEGKTLSEMGQGGPAIEALERSLKIYPFEGGTISHLGITYLNAFYADQKNVQLLDQAVKTLRYGNRVDPYNADNFFILSKVYLMTRDQAEAMRMVEISIKIDPYYAEAFLVRGILNEMSGKLDQARSDYERSFMINPNLAEPIDRLQGLNNRLGQAGKTAAFFEAALKKYSNEPAVHEQIRALYLLKVAR